MTDTQAVHAPPNAETEPCGDLSIRTLAMPADTNQNGDIFGGWLLSQMDVAGGDKGVDARPPGFRQALRGAFHVERAAARQGRHLRPRKLAAYRIHGLEIALAGDGKAGFQNVHAEFDELLRHAQLFGNRHAAAGGLLAVAQSCIENVYAVAHKSYYAGAPLDLANL